MIELGNTSNASADYCLVYNYYANVANPTSCAIPAQSTDDNGAVMGVFDQDNANSSLSHTEAYSYDTLNRLSTAVATGNATYNLTFAYDRWRNMGCTINGQTGGPCPQYSFSSSTNRITNSGFTYDAAGDLTSDGTNSYTYDGEGREISFSGGSSGLLNYNAFGHFIELNNGPGRETDSFAYDASNHFTANWNETDGFWWDEFVRNGGGMLADNRQDYDTTWLLHMDRLDSWKSVTTSAGQMMQDTLLYPWGSAWAYAGNGMGRDIRGLVRHAFPPIQFDG